MKRIAIIPARGGSKRIPRKNIKPFMGEPMISYPIKAALRSGLFDMVMVSTDDIEIAETALLHGAEVPFMRSDENSDDYSGTGNVMVEVLDRLNEKGEYFDLACCIYATTPLIRKERIIQAHRLIEKTSYDAVFPVGKYNSPIWRSYSVDAQALATMNFPEYDAFRSQDLPNSYFDSGQFYWFYPNVIKGLKNPNTFGNFKGVIELEDWEFHDIDEESDWKMAELKFKAHQIERYE